MLYEVITNTVQNPKYSFVKNFFIVEVHGNNHCYGRAMASQTLKSCKMNTIFKTKRQEYAEIV